MPEGKYRRVRLLHEGYEVLVTEPAEHWVAVKRALHIDAPLRVSILRFADGSEWSGPGDGEIWSRTPTEARRAAARAR